MFEILFPTGYTSENISIGNIDVIIRVSSTESYSGTLFTLENVVYLSSLPENNDYFWASDMVIVKNLEYDTICSCIENMLSDNVLDIAFERIN